MSDEQERRRSGRLVFYHPNAQGNGSALQFELRLNRKDETRYDCFFMEMAKQKTKGVAGRAKGAAATFDWEKKATVKLSFFDVCEMLRILEGRREKLGGGQKGLYHEAGGSNTIITMEAGQKSGAYFVGISRKTAGGEQVFRGSILLTEAEAIGLRSVFQSSLFFLAFHENVRR